MRSARWSAGGGSNRAPAPRMACFARLMRLAMVDSGTRNAAAISAVVRPPTARRVSATCDVRGQRGVAAQHQQRQRVVVARRCVGGITVRTGSSAAIAASRRRRALSLRQWSTSHRVATVSSQARGWSGMPVRGHCTTAAVSASCTASSHMSNCPCRRASTPRTCGAHSRSRSSIAGRRHAQAGTDSCMTCRTSIGYSV